MGRKHEKSPGDDSGSTVQTRKDEQKVKDRREKTRLKVQAWRKKQRENKAKYDELKKINRERRQEARLRKRQQALSDPIIQQELRKKKREEMKKYRQKKKEKAAISLPDPKIAEINKRKIEKKKEAVKRTKAWRMRIKLKDSTKQGLSNPDNEEKRHAASPEVLPKVLPKTSLYRKLNKVKEVLPTIPRSKAAIITKLIESPSTSKVLSMKEIVMTPDCRKKLEMTDTVLESLTESISEVKTRKSGEKKHAYNIICDSVLRKYKRHRSNKYFKVSVKARKPRSTWWEKKQRQRRRDALDSCIKDSVKSFFLSAEISREVPNKRETVKVRNEGEKEILQKHVMTMTLEEAYNEYKSRNPTHKIALTSFLKLKPVNVKKVSETSRRSCLCQKCCNVALKVEALTNMKKLVKDKDTLNDISTDKKSLSDATFYKYETNSDIQCLRRECQQCTGVKCLRNYLKPVVEKCKDGVVSWHQWENVEIAKDDKMKCCVSCVPKEADIETFMTSLENDMQNYPEHIFRVTWQNNRWEFVSTKSVRVLLLWSWTLVKIMGVSSKVKYSQDSSTEIK